MLRSVKRGLVSSPSYIASCNSIYNRYRTHSTHHVRGGRAQRGRSRLRCEAMVNVDVSPSVILGVGLIGSGVSLWQIRQTKPWISKDYDVVISCISLLVGGILIFQGWRLDPLLLFGQLMTTGAALSFAVEALRLRNQVYEKEEQNALEEAYRAGGRMRGFAEPEEPRLPPPQMMMDDDMTPYGRYGVPSMYYNGEEEVTGDVMVYDTTIGDVVYDDGNGEDDASYAPQSYGFESIGRRDEYDQDAEEFYNRGSRSVPPYSELGDNEDF